MNINDFISAYNSYITNPTSIDQATQTQNAAPAETQGSPLNDFLNLPVMQLLYGQQNQQAQATAAQNGTYDPTQAFRQDPGYNFAIQEGMRAMQQNAAAKGLLESGGTQRDLQGYAQGMADQNYQRFLGQQSGLFSDYQNRLDNLSQFGAGQTGAGQELQGQMALMQLLGQGMFGTGQNLSNVYTGVGSDIASLFGNQGVLNASAILNTGAAQNQNLWNSLNMQAQTGAYANAMNNGSMNSFLQGQGAQSGYNRFF